MGKGTEIGVIGLGKFGFHAASTLIELGSVVLAVDQDQEIVQRASDLLGHIYQADGTDKKALEQLGFQHLDHVIVSIGRSMEASILTVLNLQELGTKNIWVKAISHEHEKLLKRLGVDHVIFPEEFVAYQIAHRLAVPGILDYLSLSEGVILQERKVDKWEGETLRGLKLRSRFNVQVVAIKKAGEDKLNFVPEADRPLQANDSLMIIGHAKDVNKVSA